MTTGLSPLNWLGAVVMLLGTLILACGGFAVGALALAAGAFLCATNRETL